MNDPALILAGDLNLTLPAEETWGMGNAMDPLSDFFNQIFEAEKLVDIVPNAIVPTWSNGRCGGADIAKRLDCFFMFESLCDSIGRYRSWTYFVGISDHKAVILQLDFNVSFNHYPFKFNPIWLGDSNFCDLVRKEWLKASLLVQHSPLSILSKKMALVKEVVITCKFVKNKENRESLALIDLEIQRISNRCDQDLFSVDRKEYMISLEMKKKDILAQLEETWRQKRRAIWLQSGDKNTRFFHRFAYQRRLTNAIWDICDGQDGIICEQKSLNNALVRHFQYI